ncbi:MAG: DNA adenine methylase, partial [Bacteroidales bacterium]|nr:DNA adenine methylase [Bacteroidales bacterium]
MGEKGRYGVPYKGSKNGIAKDIVNILPPAGTFYDLFAGGCAITHCAMLSGKYKRFVVNDVDWRGVTLFSDAIAGKYHNEKRIVDREYFHASKETDAYVALCWSFGNNAMDYLYGKDKEDLKLSAQRMIMADTWQERLRLYRDFIKEVMARFTGTGRLSELQGLERLQGLEQLQGLERLHGLDRLRSFVGDYRDV